jgi:eukaryotic-like serine/threonine-protein kinase
MKPMKNYRLIREISSGGMGVVYEGRMLLPMGQEMPVAIKIIRAEYCGDTKEFRMFAREALTALRINHEHPNLVTTHDFGVSEQGRLYLVMEFIDGASVATIAQVSRLRHDHVRRIARDTLRALAHLHDRDVLHRDVSPGNILLSRQGAVKLADFGLVKSVNGSNSGRFRGTSAYASLEALQGGELSPRSDLYSLGVVLYELITNMRPYGSGEPEMVYRNMSVSEPVPLPDDTPTDLATLITGMMQPHPEERAFATAEDALTLLELRGEPVASDADIAALVKEWQAQPEELDRRALAETLPSLRGMAVEHDVHRRTRQLMWMLVPMAFIVGLAVAGLVFDVQARYAAATERAAEKPEPFAAEPLAECVATEPAPGVATESGQDASTADASVPEPIEASAGKSNAPARAAEPGKRRKQRAQTQAMPADDSSKQRPIFYRVPRVERTPWHIYKADDDKEESRK